MSKAEEEEAYGIGILSELNMTTGNYRAKITIGAPYSHSIGHHVLDIALVFSAIET